MIIGFNLLYLIPNQVGGTETYARALIKRLVAQRAMGDKFYLFCNQENAASFQPLASNDSVMIISLPVAASNKAWRLLFEQLCLPWYLLWHRIQLLHSLGYLSPFITSCPQITTIHDLNWHYHPEDFGKIEKLAWEWLVRLSAKSATHIITDSHASRKSLIEVLQVPAKKVSTIHCGVPELVKPASKTLQRHAIHQPYILTVTSMVEHKNVPFLLQVFATVAKKHRQLQLVIVGLGGKSAPQVASLCRELGIESRVVMPGWVSEGDLSALYHQAEVFVFTSLYEGFGLPILEAFQAGVPVVSSPAFSLREVIGEGGLLADPQNVTAFAAALDRVLSSSSLRRKLIAAGTKQKALFSWQLAADQTYNIYHMVMKFRDG